MGLKKKWSRSNLRKYFVGLGLRFETQKSTSMSSTKIYRKNKLVVEINEFYLIFFGDVDIKVPIGLIDTLKIRNNYPYLIFRVFLLKEQYLEFELMLLSEEIEE